MRLLLVRHGQSEWNVSKRVQGQAPGVSLTDLGREQAALAAERLRGSGAVRILSSDLERAHETALVIGAVLGLAVELTPDLREQAAGTLEGLCADDLEPIETSGDDLHTHRWGGGESLVDVYERLTVFWERLARESSGMTVVLVSHGGTLQVLRALLDGRGAGEVTWDDMLRNAEVVEWHG